MSGWLIDTNVVSALRNARAGDTVALWFQAQPRDTLRLSAVNLMELRYGAQLAGGTKGRDLAFWIDVYVADWFGRSLLPVGDTTLLVWRRLLQRLRQAGRPIGEPDSLIAATALEHELIVASRDVDAFLAAGVAVFNPWTHELHAPGGRARKLSRGSLAQALRAVRRSR